MKNLKYYLGFSYFPGIGPTRFDLLLSHFGDIRSAFESPIDELRKILGPVLSEKFAQFRKEFDFEKEYKKIADIKSKSNEDEYK